MEGGALFKVGGVICNNELKPNHVKEDEGHLRSSKKIILLTLQG